MSNFEQSNSVIEETCRNCEFAHVEAPACPRRALNVTEPTVVFLEDMPVGYEGKIRTDIFGIEINAQLGQAIDCVNFLAAILRVKTTECAEVKLGGTEEFVPIASYTPDTLAKISGLKQYEAQD